MASSPRKKQDCLRSRAFNSAKRSLGSRKKVRGKENNPSVNVGMKEFCFFLLYGGKMCIVGDLLSLCTKRKAESDGTSIVIQA